jgi:hypothetical protein
MPKSAREKPSEDSHERAFIEYEERMAAMQASVQALSADLQSGIDIYYLSVDQPPYYVGSFNTHFLMLEIRRQNTNLEASKNNAGIAGSSVRTGGEGRAFPGSEMGGGKEEIPKGTPHVSCCFLGISQGSAPLRHRLSI